MNDIIGNIKRRNIPFRGDRYAFNAFVSRVTGGKYADKVEFTLKESESGFDEYLLRAKDGKITVQATSGAAGGAALNAYLKKYCKYYYGILTQSGNLPKTPPDTDGDMTGESAFHYRYAFNYCTFGYSYAFNAWSDWERVTDYLILSGYNLVLNPLGNECVWLELLQKFGYTRQEAKGYISAPNYLPWQWMMNLSAFQSDYPDSWFEEQKEISKKFNAKLSAFGMGAVLPGYCGAVPDDFASKYPQAKLLRQGEWQGFVRPALLLPENGLFSEIAHEYYSLQKSLLGAEDAKYYSTDPFHEGGKKEGADLKEFAHAVLREMRNVEKDAVWAFQGWQENPDRKMLSALKKEDVVIMNLHADSCPDGGDDFLGYPHIYCVVNNFGGEQAIRGAAEKTYFLPREMAKDKNSACCGVGIMPEGVECDEILFDVISEISLQKQSAPIEDFLREYLLARYGVCSKELLSGYQILFDKLYNADIVAYPHESAFIARPSLDVTRVCRWAGAAVVEDNAYLADLVKSLLDFYGDCKERESYKTDLTALCRQLLANEAWRYVYAFNAAFQKGDKRTFEKNAAKFRKLFSLQEKVVDCDGRLNLQNYLDKAANRGKTAAEKAWLVKNAKRLITLWGEESGSVTLHDYAAREYGDLLRYFYKPRWEKYLSALENALEQNAPFVDYDRYADEVEFVNEEREYSRSVSENLDEVAKKVLQELGF